MKLMKIAVLAYLNTVVDKEDSSTEEFKEFKENINKNKLKVVLCSDEFDYNNDRLVQALLVNNLVSLGKQGTCDWRKIFQRITMEGVTDEIEELICEGFVSELDSIDINLLTKTQSKVVV